MNVVGQQIPGQVGVSIPGQLRPIGYTNKAVELKTFEEKPKPKPKPKTAAAGGGANPPKPPKTPKGPKDPKSRGQFGKDK